MATRIVPGQRTWEMSRDEKGHRTYKIKYLVEGLSTDGPANALQTPGLPVYGSPWQIDGDIDVWAFCKFEATIKPILEKEPNLYWEIEFTFSTKPDWQACKFIHFEDPLIEPMGISGSFVRYQEEAFFDRFGNPVLNSAHEQIHGSKVEFDANRPQVKIEQNVPLLQYDLLARMVDKVNAYPLWGLPPRTIKLSDVAWERLYYAICSVYYKRTLTFDVRYNTHDRRMLDEGTKVLRGYLDDATGEWTLINRAGIPPDPANPKDFIRYIDPSGTPTRVILNGHGLPAGFTTGTTDVYISLQPINLGVPLTTDTHWRPIYGLYEPPIAEWDEGFTNSYVQGNLVEWGGDIYIALETPGAFIVDSLPPNEDPIIWRFLGTIDDVPIDRGDYSVATTYDIGDIVRDVSPTKESPGLINIQHYREADFLLLGIPTIL